MKKRVLPQSVLSTGLVGFIACFFLGLYRTIPLPWATAFGIVFLIMIIGSFVSLSIPK